VAAAGRGSRAGLPYPKTLFQIQGKPILVWIMEALAPYDTTPTIVVSPDGKEAIRKCLVQRAMAAHLVVQSEPRGMGDAVLQFSRSPAHDAAENVLLMWGDIPFVEPTTVAALLAAHKAQDNDFTFATRQVESAYTLVSRDGEGRVISVRETRESSVRQNQPGERDIGLFIFRKAVVFDMLREELPEKWGVSTGEHGFLYVIGSMVARGLRVAALPIATTRDLVSFNRIEDIREHL
jgi:bifunctional UDP-N-acetylglucosamine pyrophosphorylase/glucosamine-1-phosphate N-acetyltransferase